MTTYAVLLHTCTTLHNTVRDNFLRVGRVREGVAAFLLRALASECARQRAAFLMHLNPGCLATYWLFFPTERSARVPRHFLAAEFREIFFLLKKKKIVALKESLSFTERKSISADIIKIITQMSEY